MAIDIPDRAVGDGSPADDVNQIVDEVNRIDGVVVSLGAQVATKLDQETADELYVSMEEDSDLARSTSVGVATDEQAGVDDDARLQAALVAAAALTVFGSRRVLITDKMVCNSGHAVPADNLVIEFVPGAQITLGPTPTGGLAAGKLFDLAGRTDVTVLNPQIRPPAAAYTYPGGECAVFYLAGSVRCSVVGGLIDLTGTYAGSVDGEGYTRAMDAVFVRGAAAVDNRIEGVEVRGGRITYTSAGASRTKCLRNRVFDSPANGLAGIGNNPAQYAIGCEVQGNYVASPARFGIEDWTYTRSTRIVGNYFHRAGSYAISAVGRATVVEDNDCVDTLGSVAIETTSQGSRTAANRISWPTVAPSNGVTCNGSSADPEQDSIITENYIYAPIVGIKTIGNCLGVEISENRISDWSWVGVDVSAAGNSGGVRPPRVRSNRFRQTVPATQVRYGVALALAGSEVVHNQFIYTAAAGGGSAADYAIRPGTGSNGSLIALNRVDGGGIATPAVVRVSAAGATPSGVIFVDNTLTGGAVIDTTGISAAIVRTFSASGAATASSVQVFTSSGTWNKPGGAVLVDVIAVGGGGGGGGGRRGAAGAVRCGGGGGGGGAVTRTTIPASALGSSVAVTVGAGGTGAAATGADDTSGAAGTAGVTSTFGTLVRAGGGGAGQGGTASTGTGGSVATGHDPGGAGASASTTGGAGNGNSPGAGGAAGGGAGGGLTAGNAESSGGAGAAPVVAVYSVGAAGGPGGGAGGAPGSVAPTGSGLPGPSAGGGGSAAAAAGGSGGDGGIYGGGGGGGGASANGNVSGGGGDGAAGIVVVITEA